MAVSHKLMVMVSSFFVLVYSFLYFFVIFDVFHLVKLATCRFFGTLYIYILYRIVALNNYE